MSMIFYSIDRGGADYERILCFSTEIAIVSGMSKFYAVRRGSPAGIYTSWQECSKAVTGIANAEYKAFATLSEAETFIADTHISDRQQYSTTAQIYTDGSFVQKRGGLAVVWPAEKKEIASAFNDRPTSNRTELAAVYVALKLFESCDRSKWQKAIIYTDSQLTYNILKKFCSCWERKGWVTQKNTPVKNQDLIRPCWDLYKRLQPCVRILWIRGHNGNIHNERADKLAKMASLQQLNVKPEHEDK